MAHLVLIVEDNDMNLKLARDVLQFHGFKTIEARTATEGLSLAQTEQPDLVLMDVQLPDCDGATALARLRANPRTSSIPVVAVTAFAMNGDHERFLEAGFDGYLAKPIDIRSFADQVASYCRTSSRDA